MRFSGCPETFGHLMEVKRRASKHGVNKQIYIQLSDHLRS